VFYAVGVAYGRDPSLAEEDANLLEPLWRVAQGRLQTSRLQFPTTLPSGLTSPCPPDIPTPTTRAARWSLSHFSINGGASRPGVCGPRPPRDDGQIGTSLGGAAASGRIRGRPARARRSIWCGR